MSPRHSQAKFERLLPPAAPRTGATLIEMMVFCSILAMVSLFTMGALGEARLLRGRARDRAALTLLAQETLDRIRAMPATKLVKGMEWRHERSWPSGVKVRVTLEPRSDGAWDLDVQVERESVEGLRPVRLATIRPGEGR